MAVKTAIKPIPAYTATQLAQQRARAQKQAGLGYLSPTPGPIVTVPKSVGYTGSGWSYPLAATGVQATYTPSGTTYTNVPPGGVPLSPGDVPTYSPPSLDKPPSAAMINQPINYQPSIDEINADPTYGAALDAYNTQLASQRQQLALQIAQRAIASGYDISGALSSSPDLQQYASALTPDVVQQAKDNPFSDAALAAQAYNRAMQNNAYNQAARGTLGSGSQVTGRNALDQQNALSTYQGLQAALSGIRGDVGTELGAEASGYQNLQSTREQVAARLSQLAGAAYATGNDTGSYEAGYQTVPGTGGLGPTGAPGVPSAAPGVPGQTLPSGQTQGTGIQWGGGTVTSVAQMKKILGASGVSYQTWKNNHPAAAAKLEGRG